MRFDTIIIGGGLSSLVCGIAQQKAGRKCLIVSAGQNALHFSSGAFGLLSRMPDGTPVDEPLSAISSLPEDHPYSKIGEDGVRAYLDKVQPFFHDCGVELSRCGQTSQNFQRFTPVGSFKPAWFTLNEADVFPSKDARIEGKALIVNFAGFLDFNSRFIAEGLERRGATCRIEAVRHPEVERLRVNPSEMRSVNIARVMDREENWKQFVHQVRGMMNGEDIVVLPEVFGLTNPAVIGWISEMIPAKVMFVGTMPPSVPGLRAQKLLKKSFEEAGGVFLPGDVALSPKFDGNRVRSIRTVNLGANEIEADSFVLASGSFFGKGIEAVPGSVTEPVFGLDVDYPADRTSWYAPEMSDRQAYLGFGVKTDGCFRAFKDGNVVDNLYVIGAELGGCNPLAEGSGACVAILSAFKVADEIIG